MPGYGVANPGSLIGFVFLFIAFQLQSGQCALPNSLPLFVQARGVFLGACNFIATCFNATANAPFGSSFCPWQTSLCCYRRHSGAASCIVFSLKKEWPTAGGAVLRRVRVEDGLGGRALVCFACFAALFACLVCCFVLAFGCFCPCWVHSSFGQRHPVWFVCCASRGHRFALGTGGLKQSLLVGGIGPVYSLPKLCFKPFRSFF